MIHFLMEVDLLDVLNHPVEIPTYPIHPVGFGRSSVYGARYAAKRVFDQTLEHVVRHSIEIGTVIGPQGNVAFVSISDNGKEIGVEKYFAVVG